MFAMLPKGLLSRPSSPLKLAGSVAICLFILSYLFGRSIRDILDPTSSVGHQASSHTSAAPTNQPPCRKIEGADDVLVIVKTGSTELQDKLPVHLRTTLSCYPETVIFSDYEEDLDGRHIFDALGQVDELIKSTHNDYALYRRLKAEGRKALEPAELSGILAGSGGTGGKVDNPGWRLDKWKFLPMLNRTLEMYPQKKWYVFVETDTYLVWSNLLEWISLLDAEKPVYAGYQMQIGDQIFAHGGAGFVVSNPAMHRVVDHVAKNKSWWEEYTDDHWAGDCVLGKAFQEAGVQLLWSWPLTQGDKPGTLNPFKNDYGYRMWCYPAVTYHHLSVDEIETMWQFEQDWIQHHRSPLRQSDVYKALVFPQLASERNDWDNLSGEDNEGPDMERLEDCRTLCQSQGDCLQYRLAAGKCATSYEIKLGSSVSAEKRVQSGWMTERIEKAVRDVEPCESKDWILR